jgi:hypothetical protein
MEDFLSAQSVRDSLTSKGAQHAGSLRSNSCNWPREA